MEDSIFTTYSWVLILRGILAVLFGLLALLWTGLTLELLVFIFAAYALIDGTLAIIHSFGASKEGKKWWVLLLEGLCGIALGVLVLVWPAMVIMILIYLIAIWALLTGVVEFFVSFAIPWGEWPKWLMFFAGILSIVLGILMFAYPIATVAVLIWFLGAYCLVFGIMLIAMGFKVYGSRNKVAA